MNGIFEKKKIAQVILGGAFVALVGCDSKTPESEAALAPEVENQEVQTKKVKAPTYTATALTRSAWLREQLPETAFFYARIPSLWDLASYKDDSFKFAHGNKAYLKEIKKIQEASAKWFKKGEADIETLLTLLGSQMDGPVEVVAYGQDNQPQLLISSHVRFTQEKELKAIIELLISKRVIIDELEPMQNGAGVLMTKAAPLAYKWDQNLGRLNLMLNLQGADSTSLDSAFSALKPNPTSPMFSNEQVMDDSHKGLYLWFNNQLASPVYQPLLPPDAAMPMAAMGAHQIETVAASWGVSNGKGRLKVQLDAPSESMVRQFIPANKNSYPIKTAGKPGLALSLSLPAYSDFKRLEMMAGGLNNNKYQESKAKASEALGYPVDNWFKAIGPEVVLISDQAGEYLAVRLRSPEEFNKIMTATKAWPSARYESRNINGQEIHHLKLPSMYSSAEEEMAADKNFSPLLADLITKIGTHLYWQQEGEFLIMADLPQVLFDRQAMLSDQTLEQWLVEEQRQDISASTFAFSGNIRNAPRRIYYYYLNGLQALGDLTNANQDLLGLPSAGQLQLAKQGTFGVQLDSSDKKLAMEFTFESSPADIVLAGEGAATIAAVGVMAAVAIPAYDEYTKRAQIAEVYFASSEVRRKLEQFHRDSGRFPNEQEMGKFYDDFYWDYPIDDIEVEPDTGIVYISFEKDIREHSGEVLELHPDLTNAGISWYCEAEYIPRKHMPAECR